MKPKFICLLLSFGILLNISAQKKNYVSLETGVFFGNANQNIADGMRKSGFADKRTASFFGLFLWDTEYPIKRTDKSQYRIRAGHFIKNKMAIEAGFGLSYYGIVEGYDEGTGGAHSLAMTSQIHSLYAAIVLSDSTRRVGIGIGPALSFYKLTTSISGQPNTSKTSVLPGVMATTYINVISRRFWFLGFRGDLSLTTAAKIDEININATAGNPKSSTFKSTKAGSFNGSVSLHAGIRFTKK